MSYTLLFMVLQGPCMMHVSTEYLLMQTRAKPFAAGAVVSLGGAAPPKIWNSSVPRNSASRQRASSDLIWPVLDRTRFTCSLQSIPQHTFTKETAVRCAGSALLRCLCPVQLAGCSAQLDKGVTWVMQLQEGSMCHVSCSPLQGCQCTSPAQVALLQLLGSCMGRAEP